MTDIHETWLARQRMRWVRPDADRYTRPDAERYMRPDAARFLRPDRDRYLRPEFRERKDAQDARHEPQSADNFEKMDEATRTQVRLEVASLRLELALLRLGERWRKANFNPNQPRVPAGNPDGGQWTSEGGGAGRNDPRVLSDATPDNEWKPGDQYASRNERRRPGSVLVRIGDKLVSATDRQKLNLDTANSQANEAISRLRAVEPDWRPVRSQYDDTVESKIKEARELVLEAEGRLVELGHQSPQRLIEIYRGQNSPLDLFGRETWPRDKGVVGFTILNRLPVFGTNSGAPEHVYTPAYRAAADRWRNVLVEHYPDDFPDENIGWKPNDAMYHAEAAVLLRAAERNGGTLAGRVMKVFVDNEMCRSCPTLLPILGRELGDPAVTFVDPWGRERTMKNGKWD